jgi:UDP-glucose 4-epimerase
MFHWNGTKVLVTGGSCFIGSHLVERLLSLGARVRVAVNSPCRTLGNLRPVRERIEIQEGDLRDRACVRRAMTGTRVVFHLAASHGGRGYITAHPADCASNLVLDGIVFEEASRARLERVCFASSACVYSSQSQLATDGPAALLKEESADPFRDGHAAADSEYGWAKLMGELALKAYWRQHGLKSVCCRLFNVYGERMNETHAIIALIAKAFIGMDPYEIWGDGQQDRNFTYVTDTVEGMIRACERIEDASPVNIGTEEHIRIIDVANRIFAEVGFNPRAIKFDTSKPVGVASRAADLTRCRERLAWEPSTSFEDGLRRTIRWYCSTHDRAEVAERLRVRLMER